MDHRLVLPRLVRRTLLSSRLLIPCISYLVINYDPRRQGPLKIIVNIDSRAHAHLQRLPQASKDDRRNTDQGNIHETPPNCDASTHDPLAQSQAHHLQAHIDKLTISE